MKTLKSLTFGIIIGAFAFIGCKKEKAYENNNTQSAFQYDLQSQVPYSNISVREKGFKGEKGSTYVLVFKDMRTVNLTIDDLYRQVGEWNRAFYEQHKDLNDDERNALEEKLGFDEQQPLIDFDNQFKFYSLYQKIANEELEWLNHDKLDPKTDPDNHFIVQYSIRAVLNTDCEIQIGDSLYKLTEEGYFTICDKSMLTLSALNDNMQNYQSIPNVIFVGNEFDKASGCESMRRNNGIVEQVPYRIKWVVSHWTYPWVRRCAAKIDNYKKSGTWKKHSCYCKAMVFGYISGVDSSGNANCDVQLNFNPGQYLMVGNVKDLEHYINVSTRTKSTWVKSYFYGAGTLTHNQTLTW
jgi:hypothetical protein